MMKNNTAIDFLHGKSFTQWKTHLQYFVSEYWWQKYKEISI